MKELIKNLIIIILIILTFLVFNEPGPVWFFPVFLVFYLLRKVVIRITKILIPQLPLKYFIAGLATGLFIEFLAIVNSQKLLAEQRALFHPEPIPDLILGIGYYSMLTLGCYFILRKYEFSIKQFFILGGIFGLILEEHGKILLQFLSGNVLGGIYVFLSYGSFLTLPYMLFKEDFESIKRRKSNFLKYIIYFLILIFSYLMFFLYYLLINSIISG